MSRKDKFKEILRVVVVGVQSDHGSGGDPFGRLVCLRRTLVSSGRGGIFGNFGFEVLLEEEIGSVIEGAHLQGDELMLGFGEFAAVGKVCLLVGSISVGELIMRQVT